MPGQDQQQVSGPNLVDSEGAELGPNLVDSEGAELGPNLVDSEGAELRGTRQMLYSGRI